MPQRGRVGQGPELCLALRAMRFPKPLIPATLVKRYKRFLADVTFADGAAVTATCPNTGSMIGLTDPGLKVWVSHSDSPTRVHAHSHELIEVDLGKGPSLAEHPDSVTERGAKPLPPRRSPSVHRPTRLPRPSRSRPLCAPSGW